MKTTNVRVTLAQGDTKRLKAFVDVTFDGCFVIHGMKVIEGTNGFFVAMPNKKGKDGKFRDICHPITIDMREDLEKIILDEYEKALKVKE